MNNHESSSLSLGTKEITRAVRCRAGFLLPTGVFRFFGVYVLSVEDRIRPLTAAHLLGYFLGCLGFEVDSAPPMDTPISEKENAQTGRSAYSKIFEGRD